MSVRLHLELSARALRRAAQAKLTLAMALLLANRGGAIGKMR